MPANALKEHKSVLAKFLADLAADETERSDAVEPAIWTRVRHRHGKSRDVPKMSAVSTSERGLGHR